MTVDETSLTFTSGVVPVKKGQVNGEVEHLI